MKLHNYGKGFKKARKRARLTQQSFCDEFGKISKRGSITIDTCRNWEQGRTLPDAETLVELSNFYKVSIDYLLDRSDCTTVENEYISQMTGLSDTSIQTLISCKTGGILHDDDFPIIDLLNFILSDNVLFRDFLNYLGLYINNTYDTPCYRDPDKHIYVPVPDDNIRNTPFVLSKNERYIAVGKKQKEKVCGEDAYQTICLPVSLLESHAVRIIQSVIDEWKRKWKEEKR